MPNSREQLFQRLAELGIETNTVEHDAVYTVEEARALRGDLPGAHSKNLFLKDKKGVIWLVVCDADRPIDLKVLRKQIGAGHLSFGKPDLLEEILGVEPGAVTPFGLINDQERRVQVVLDKEMLEASPLNFHPLDNTATTQIEAHDLIAFIRSCGHDPRIVEL